MKRILTPLLGITVLLTVSTARADNWMSRLPDYQYVATVSIPGTHDSATGSGWTSATVNLNADKYSKTQTTSLTEQWEQGIRAFDFRPAEQNGYMSLNHGVQVTRLKFEEELTRLCGLLDENPSEFVVIHLLRGTGDNYVSRVRSVLAQYQSHIVPFRADLTVGDLRGKMLILCREWDDWDNQRALGSGSFGWWEETSKAENPDGADSYILSPDGNRAKCVMQDLANTSGSGALERKMNLMTSLLDWTTGHRTRNAGDICWVFNMASAYDKEEDLFFQKLSSSEGYRDNAQHTNKLVADYLASHSGPAGIILMDYVGGDDCYGNTAVRAIIENNFRLATNTYLPTADLHWLHRGTPSIADYNGDGLSDIYYGGEQYDWQVKGLLYTQQPDGTFTREESGVGSSGQTSRPEDFAFGTHGLPPTAYGYSRWLDFDNDGHLDFLCTTRSDNDLQLGDKTYLYRNGGSATGYRFTLVAGTDFLNGQNEHADERNGQNNSSISFADYDRDGYQDIVQQAWADGREAVVFHNNGDGTFSRAVELTKMSHGSVTFGDLDNDGWPDIVETGWEDGNHYCEFYVYRNRQDGTFEELRMTDRGFVGLCNSDVCLVDLNGDGLLDIVAAGQNGGERTDIYVNQGGFAFSHVMNHGIDGADEPVLQTADLNADGRPDLIITSKTFGQPRIYLQDADCHFTEMNQPGLPDMGQGGLALGDLTGRGAVDAFVVGNGVASVCRLAVAPARTPSQPTGLKAVRNADGTVTLTWQAASEPGLDAARLSYNIYMRNEDTGSLSMLLPADPATGHLRTVQDMQNALRGTLSYTVRPHGRGRFTVGVQAIDPAYATSTFATAAFSLSPAGDVNGDNQVTIADVTALVNLILGKDTDLQYDHAAADVNGDGQMTIADVTALVNLILGK